VSPKPVEKLLLFKHTLEIFCFAIYKVMCKDNVDIRHIGNTQMPYVREKIVLENGLRVLLDERSSSEAVTITCLVRAGSRNDFPKKDGLAHVVEHLLFRSRWSNEEKSLLKAVEDVGGKATGFTSIDRTAFSVYIHKDEVILGLKFISKIVCDLPVDKESFELEKDIIAHEIQIIGEDGPYAIQRNKYELLGGKESLKHSIGGTKSKIKKISLQDISSFYDKFYTARNMTLSVVGNFYSGDLISKINNLFGAMKPGSPQAESIRLGGIGPKLKAKATPIHVIAVFFRCPSYRDKDLAVVELISDILSEGAHSLLFQSLREKHGLVYAVEGCLALSADFGSLDIITSTNAKNNKLVLTKIIDCVFQICNLTITDNELSKFKNRLIKRSLLLFEDTRMASMWYAEREILSSRENADDFMQWIEEINSISVQDFKGITKELFAQENWFIYSLGYIPFWHRRSILRHIRKISPAPSATNRY
jgi:predicted Zn-dependent peptidase